MNPGHATPRKLLLLFLGSIAAIAIVMAFITTLALRSTLDIKVDSSVTEEVKIYIYSKKQSKNIKEIRAAAGRTISVRLPIDEYSVTAGQTKRETVGFARLQRFKKSNLVIKLEPQKVLEKLGSESLGCDVIAGDTLHSYSCSSESLILQHKYYSDRFDNPEPILESITQTPFSPPYQDGMLMKSQNDTFVLNYLNLLNYHLGPINVPNGLDLDTTNISTDQASAANTRFLLTNNEAGLIYSYENAGDSNPRQFSLRDIAGDYSQQASISYAIGGSQLLIFVGKGDTSYETEEGAEGAAGVKENWLYVISLDANNNTRRLRLPSNLTAGKIYMAGGSVAIKQESRLLLYSLSEEPELRGFFDDVDSETASSNGLLFIKGNSIYSFDAESGQAKMLLGSTRLRVSGLGNSKKGPIFNSFIEGDSSAILHSYLITPVDAAGHRPEDYLPYNPQELPIYKMDYRKNEIKFQLALTSIGTDKSAGQIFYEQSEYEAAKSKILKRLQKDGFDLAKYKIFFSL